MKIVFITNDISYYGASRSLKTFIEGINRLNIENKIEIHLIVPKRLKNRNDFDYLENWFGVPKDRIYEFSLPFYNNYKGNIKSVFHYLVNWRWFLSANKLYRFLQAQDFNFIHLNSLTLINVAKNDFNFVLHVREILKDFRDRAFLQKKLNDTNKIVFIDYATAKAFDKFQLPENITINNPFSMEHLKTLECSDELDMLTEIGKEKIIFALIGKIHDEKGTEFIIDAFNKFLNEDVLLIIKGGGERSYIDYVKSIAGPKVLFLDESPNVENIYATADYILRGEGYPCIGRTTFEGLYSGTGVILPGFLEYYKENVLEYNTFQDDLFTYEPRDTISLQRIISNAKKRSQKDRKLRSNIKSYTNTFLNFVTNENANY